MEDGLDRVVSRGDVGEHVYRDAVGGDGRSTGRQEERFGLAALRGEPLAVAGGDGGIGVNHDDAFSAVDDDGGAVGNREHVLADADDGGDAE